jgi:hypothetical protein
MMLSRSLLALVAGLAIGACGDSDSDDSGSTAEPGPGAFAADYADSNDFFTLMDDSVKGSSPHGTVRIWYSSNISELINDASFVVPEGTVSIKEFDGDSDGTLDGYAVMVKKGDDYDPDNGNWYYEMRDAKGDVMAMPPAGKIKDCIDCHAAAKKTDYLAGTTL